jgi:hypothetical protein
VNTSGQAVVKGFVCQTDTGELPPGFPVGAFDPTKPGNGNSFSFDTTTNTWSFNWKLQFAPSPGVLKNLPTGTYIVQVRNSLTGQSNPTLTLPDKGTNCGGNIGALIKVVKQ